METTDMQAIREALKLCKEILYAQADRGHYPPEALQVNGGNGLGFITDALAILDKIDKFGEGVSGVRPAVAWFAQQMEAALRRNDHKGGWSEMDHEALIMRCGDEIAELKHCWYLGRGKQKESNEKIISEAADVANFAMMIADNQGPRIGHQHPASPSPDKSAPAKAPAEDGMMTAEEHSEVVHILLTEFTKILNAVSEKLKSIGVLGELDMGALETIAQHPLFAAKAREIAQAALKSNTPEHGN